MKSINTHKWGWLKEIIPIFVLLVLTSLFFSEIIFQNKIFIHRDLSRFFYPLREFSVNQFRTFRIPLWNPYMHCGTPHLAELQTCVFYPLSIIYLLFNYPQAFNYFIVVHVFLAGFFTYLLMREWRHSRYAAFFSATVFMFGGYIISVINLLASLASVVWLPLVILFYERATKKEWAKNSIITGIFLTLMLLGGEPIILYATVFILILFSSVLSSQYRPRDTLFTGPSAQRGSSRSQSTADPVLRNPGIAIKSLLLALVIAAGLSCFQILPFMEFLSHTSRSAMDFNEASMWSLPPYALLDLFIPYMSESDYLYKDYWMRQSWLLVYYMGIFSVICAFISLRFDARRKRRLFFYIFVAGLVLSFGRYTPVYYFLYRSMPGFELSRYPIKFFFMVAFSLAILAGMGLDHYRKSIGFSTSDEKGELGSLADYIGVGRFLKLLLILACMSSFLYLVFNIRFGQVYNLLYNKMLAFFPNFVEKKADLAQMVFVVLYNTKRAIGYFMLLALLMFLPLKNKTRLRFIIPLLLCVSLMDIFTANRHVYQNMNLKGFLEPGANVTFLKKDKELFRIFNSPATIRQNVFVPERDYFEGVRSLKERMAANRNVSFGIYSAYGYGSLYNRRHEEVIEAIIEGELPDKTNLLNLLNVKYVISPKDFEAEGYTLLRKGKKANIYRNENVMPRAFLADEIVSVSNELEILERLKSKEFNPSKEVILEEVFELLGGHPSDGYKEESVEFLDYQPNHVVIEAKANKPKFLILSDSHYPGWKAFVDGRRTKIYRADYILRAVYLEAGKHIIRFKYDPFSFKLGLIITFLTIVAIAINGRILWKRRRSLL